MTSIKGCSAKYSSKRIFERVVFLANESTVFMVVTDGQNLMLMVLVTVQQHHSCVVIGLLMCEKHTSQADS
jgi:hypothetical protein